MESADEVSYSTNEEEDTSEEDTTDANKPSGCIELSILDPKSTTEDEEWTSEQHTIGAFRWTLTANQSKDGDFKMSLQCSADADLVHWALTATVTITIADATTKFARHVFTDAKSYYRYENLDGWDEIIDPESSVLEDDGSLTVTAYVRILDSVVQPRPPPATFGPSPTADVALIVQNQRFWVSKAALALHSTYFHALFYDEFREHGQDEIELGEDMLADEFVDFLRMIYPEGLNVNEENVGHLLKVADRVDAASVRRQCVGFLMRPNTLSLGQTLALADRYHLPVVTLTCLGQIDSMKSILRLLHSRHYASFSDQLVRKLFECASALFD